VLTGARGSGKTTLLSKLFPEDLPGITTWAEPYKSVFMKDNRDGTSVKIADYDASIRGTKQKMVLRGDVLCTFGIPALNRCMQSKSEWISIDEIGFLEESCEPFKAAIRDLFDHKRVIAVVRKQDLPFLNELRSRPDAFVVDLDQPFGNAGCVIMASGLGNRFGGNKLMADFLGEPLIARILDATEGLFAKRVVVTRHESVADLCKGKDIPVVLHDLPHRSDTVRLGLEAVGDADRCMFCPGDQPLLSRETMESLLLSAVSKPDAIWRACCDSTPGSPVLFPTWTFPELLTLPEGKGGGVIIKRYPERCEMQPVSDPWELVDADTPEILEQLRQHALNQENRSNI
jgi:molybdenum cofactor cytidylyltransferase